MSEQGLTILLIGLVSTVLLLGVVRYRHRLTPKSLSNQLLVAFVGVVIISIGLVVVAVAWQIRTTLTEQRGEDFVALAQLNSQRLAEQLATHVTRLDDMSENSQLTRYALFATRTLESLPPSERDAKIQVQEEERNNPDSFLRSTIRWSPVSIVFNDVIDSFPIFTQLILTDAYGGLVATSGELPAHYYHGDQDWWRETWNDGQGDVYVGNPRLSPDGQTATLDIAVPVYSLFNRSEPGGLDSNEEESFKFLGVLRGRLRLDELSIFVDIPDKATYELALVDNATGSLLYSSEPGKTGGQIATGIQEYIKDNPVDWNIDPDEMGQNVILSHAAIRPSPEQGFLSPLDWVIIIQEPETLALEKMGDFLQPVLMGGLVALGLAVLVGSGVAWQITRPINALTNVAVEMVRGQLQRSAPVSGPAEIQTLAQAFNSMTEQLRQVLTGLEQQVAARTARLESVASLGERLSAILSLEELLAQVVNQIQEQFGYYHAHVYLFDDQGENLVVAAGTGPAGAVMKAAGHSIPLDALTSLVARAARTGQVVRVDSVREAEGWLPNPLLPDTCSEMAVPITLEGRVVGVLDVQEDEIAGLDEGDAALLRSLANQVAVAINNAHLFEAAETALAEAREAQQQYSEQVWDRSRVLQRGRGRVQFSVGESTALSETQLAEARQLALAQKEPAVVTLNSAEQADPTAVEQSSGVDDETECTPQHALVAPITLGETIIGNLQLHGVDPSKKWSESELILISTVVDQVAQTAENLRLLDETQERASREQLVGQISDKLRRAPDIETLMKVAVSELSRVLDPARTFVRLGPDVELDVAQNESSDGDGLVPPEGQDQIETESELYAEAAEVGEDVGQSRSLVSSAPSKLGEETPVEYQWATSSEPALVPVQENIPDVDKPAGVETPAPVEDEVTTPTHSTTEAAEDGPEQAEEIAPNTVRD